MSSIVVAAAGALMGLAMFAVVWALVPVRIVDAPTAPDRTIPAGAGPAPTGAWQWLVARWADHANTREGLLLGAPAADLQLLGRTLPGYLSTRLAWGLAGLAAPVLLTVALLVVGVAPPAPFSGVLAVAAALGCSLIPAVAVREQAKTAREELRRAVAAYADLIAQQRVAGASPVQAMTDAAAVAHGWQFQRIRAALDHGRRRGIPPWESARQLAEQLAVPELGELADVLAAASQGSSVATTLTSQAAAMRTAAIATDQAGANEVSERMIYPVTLLGLGFLLLLVYPAIVRLLSA